MTLIAKKIICLLFTTSLMAEFTFEPETNIDLIVEKIRTGVNVDLNIKSLSEINDKKAEFILGIYYDENKDLEKAKIHYKKAFLLGEYQAAHNLALISDLPSEKEEFFYKSFKSGVSNDLILAYLVRKNKTYLIEALNKNVDGAYKIAALHFKGTKKGISYAKKAYDKKESYVEYARTLDKRGFLKILLEGVKSSDIDSILVYSDILINNDKLEKALELLESLKEKNTLSEYFYLKSLIFFKTDRFRQAKTSIFRAKKINGNISKYSKLENKICAKANVCLSIL